MLLNAEFWPRLVKLSKNKFEIPYAKLKIYVIGVKGHKVFMPLESGLILWHIDSILVSLLYLFLRELY